MTCFPAITSEPAPADRVIRNEPTLNHCRYSCGFASIRGFNTSPPPRTSVVVEPEFLLVTHSVERLGCSVGSFKCRSPLFQGLRRSVPNLHSILFPAPAWPSLCHVFDVASLASGAVFLLVGAHADVAHRGLCGCHAFVPSLIWFRRGDVATPEAHTYLDLAAGIHCRAASSHRIVREGVGEFRWLLFADSSHTMRAIQEYIL